MKSILNIIIFGGIAFFTIKLNPSYVNSSIASITKPQCNIKGNISYNSGRKLYHLPGMKDYETTVIDAFRGERWFCSESEAIRNDWSKAPR